MPTATRTRGPQSDGADDVGPFFGLAFGITWALQLPAVLAKQGMLPGPPDAYMPFALLGVFGPLIAATLITAREGGRPALRELYGGLRKWRVSISYYFVALALPGLLLTGALGLLRLAGREGPIAYLPSGGRLIAAFVIALAEEIGWRGFALPRLQNRMPSFGASAVIGVLWTLWHIPMFLGVGVPLSLLLVMLLYFTGGSLVFTWIYNRSGGSLVLAVLAHVGAHLDNSHAALPADAIPLVVNAIVYGALGLAVSGTRHFNVARERGTRHAPFPD